MRMTEKARARKEKEKRKKLTGRNGEEKGEKK